MERVTRPAAFTRFGRRAGLLGLLLAALLAIGAAGASAQVAHLPNGDTLGYQPLPGAPPAGQAKGLSEFGPPLLFWGGPVMTSNTNYAIYWSPPGAAKFAKKFTGGVNKYFKDIAHDSGGNQNVESVLTQYGAPYSSHFGGQIKDKDPLPPNGCKKAPICLTDAQLRAEIRHVVESKGLPADLSHEYFLLTAPGIESCFEATSAVCSANSSSPYYCAYHGDIPVPSGVIIYANDPYVFEKNCDEPNHPNGPSDSALLGGLSHEHSESVTDPELDAWFNERGEEIGDICRVFEPKREFGEPLGTAPDGSPYNQLINKHRYWYQQEWSNEGSACKQRLP